jgi:exonuclease III
MSKLNFLTLNIRGINDANKTNFLKDYLRDQKVDICFLQETHINSPDYVDELGNVFSDFFCYFTINFDKTKGVGILIRKNISHDISHIIPNISHISHNISNVIHISHISHIYINHSNQKYYSYSSY